MTRALRAALVAVVLAACTADPEEAEPTIRRAGIDRGGTSRVVFVGPVRVEAAPGEVVRIEHRGRPSEAETATTHAFVAAAPGRLPPLFVSAAGGAVPNAGVWGECRGGRPEDAAFGCPIPPLDAPMTWDGRAYWSTGAMTPGEHRNVPLAPDIRPGLHTLTCAFHPRLRVEVRVTAGPRSLRYPPVRDPAEVPARPSDRPPRAVLAGFEVAEPKAIVNAFFPEVVRVPAGRRVTWRVGGRDPHDVVFGDEHPDLLDSTPADAAPEAPAEWDGVGEVRSGFLSTDPSAPGGISFSLTFTRPGRYAYACRFHAGMRGVVVVRPAR